MRSWLGTQYLIVIGYSVLTLFLWGPMVVLAIAIVSVPLSAFFRLQHEAMRRGIVAREALRVITVFLLLLGALIAVLPFVLSEIFWFTKETLFDQGRESLFWRMGRNAFVVIGIYIPYAWCTRIFQSIVERKGPEGVQQLKSSFLAVVWLMGILSKPFKFVGIVVLALLLVVGVAFGIGGLLILLGIYSAVETFVEPSLRVEYTMMVGGLLLSLTPIFYLTFWWWSKDVLADALVGEDAS